MTNTDKLLIFRIEEQNFAISLEVVAVVINIVEICELPHAPEYILGIINYYGEVLPVIDLRFIFQQKSRDIELSDKLIVVKFSEQPICLWVDQIGEIIDFKPDMIKESNNFFMEMNYIDGIFMLENDIVFLQNVENFFTKEVMEKLHELVSTHKQISSAKMN